MNSNNDRKSYLPITMFFPLNASRVFMNSAVSRHVSGASGKRLLDSLSVLLLFIFELL